MQRDQYASLLKKRHKQRIAVSILQLNGRITHESLMDEVFLGYRQRRIVLMTNTAGQDPRLPRLAADIAIPSFEVLARVHQPHYQYRLLPLICQDVEAFAAMQAICSSPGSPFAIQNRIDARELTFRFHAMSNGVAGVPATNTNRAQISSFFEQYMTEAERAMPLAARRLPITGVEYQGLMFKQGKKTDDPSAQIASAEASGENEGGRSIESESSAAAAAQSAGTRGRLRYSSAAALVTTHEFLTATGIVQRALMRDFFESPTYALLASNTDTINSVLRATHRLHVMAVKRPVGVALSASGTMATVGVNNGNDDEAGSVLFPSLSSSSLSLPSLTVSPMVAAAATASGKASLTALQEVKELEAFSTRRRSLLALAKEKNIFVYEKVAEGQYQYAC